MDAEAPKIVIPISCAPKKAPCPHCGKLGRRKRTLAREVRTLAYKTIAILKITYGEYAARCDCCSSFRTNPDGVLPKAKYDNKVRQAVLDRIIDDGLNVEATRHSLERDFWLDLSTGFVYDCLRDAAAELDLAQHRQAVLQRHGLSPKVVVTDRSPLYPALLAALWPHAEHQLCVFHVMQDINDLVLGAVRRLRRKLARRGACGRRRRRGRPSKAQQRRRRQRGATAKDKANFVFQHRYLIVTRRENLSDKQQKDLATMLEYLPELRTLRKFVDAIDRLFATDQSEHQAWCRWHALRRRAEYQAIPELAEVLELLSESQFHKMIAFLRGPAKHRRQVRTNNHVERCNRQLRFWEKVRYKWRRRRTLVRFVVLALDHWWSRCFSQEPATSRKRIRCTKSLAKAA